MKYAIQIIMIVLFIIAFGVLSCTKQKKWEELFPEFKSLYQKQQFADAESIARETLEAAKADQSEKKNSRIATALNALGGALFMQEKYEEALTVYKEELDFEKKVFGEHNVDIASTLGKVAACYYRLGSLVAGLTIAEESLDMFSDVAPSNNPDYLSTRLVLGNIYYEIGRYNEADFHFTKVISITDSLQVISNPITLSDRLAASLGLSMIYINTGHYVEADTLIQQLWVYCENNPSSNQELCATVIEAGAQLYGKTKNYQKAEELHIRAIEAMQQARGYQYPKLAVLLGNFGSLYTDMQQYKKADSILHEALKIQQMKGTHSLQEATILQNIGFNYMEMKEYDKAELAIHNALKICEEAAGPNNLILIKMLENLVTVYYKAGKEAEANAAEERLNKIKGFNKAI